MRRPLALACLAYIITVMMILTINPPPSFHSPVEDGAWCVLEGTVYEKERKEDVLYISVKHVKLFDQSGQQSTNKFKEQSENKNSIIQTLKEIKTSIQYTESSVESNTIDQLKGVLCLFQGEEPKNGSRIRLKGKVYEIPTATNPGEFDQHFYWQIHKIDMRMKDCSLLQQSEKYDHWRERLFHLKEKCEQRFEGLLPQKHASVMKAMLLGNKKELDGEIKELYQKNGISHMLAISGLHISIIGMGLYRLLRKGYIPIGVAAAICIFFMYQYGIMTGMSSSAARAILMFLIQLLGKTVGRSYDMLTATMIAGVCIVMEQPLYVFYTGFQLSFGAILGIGLLYPVLQSHLGNHKKLQPLAASLAISLTTMPAILYAYYELPRYAIFLNLLVIPLLTVLVVVGILLNILGGISAFMGGLLAIPCIAILEFYEKLCLLAGYLPEQTWITGKPEVWNICLFYLGLLFLVLLQERLSGTYKTYLLIMAVCILTTKVNDNLKVTFLDVGQGDGIVIQNDNGNVYLVDGGSTTKKELGKYQLIPFLKQAGISEVEAAFLSHPDEDHISGVRTLLEQSGANGIIIKRLVLPDASERIKEEELADLCKLAMANGIEVYDIKSGDVLSDGKLKFTCVGPTSGIETGEMNEISEVLLAQYEDFFMLLTGDTTGNEEQKMINRLKDANINKITVLKVAHHGSRFSTPDTLLEQIKPLCAIISAGKNNTYGHPHKELLERLQEHHVGWIRTDEYGAITIETDGEKMKIRRFLEK